MLIVKSRCRCNICETSAGVLNTCWLFLERFYKVIGKSFLIKDVFVFFLLHRMFQNTKRKKRIKKIRRDRKTKKVRKEQLWNHDTISLISVGMHNTIKGTVFSIVFRMVSLRHSRSRFTKIDQVRWEAGNVFGLMNNKQRQLPPIPSFHTRSCSLNWTPKNQIENI